MKKSHVCFMIISLFFNLQSYSQKNQKMLKVFIQGSSLDIDYLKKSIPIVDFVYDRSYADAVIIFSDENTASEGVKRTIFVEGRNDFENLSDTISFMLDGNNTSDDTRKTTVNFMKFALTPFFMHAELTDNIVISINSNVNNAEIVKKDPWRGWYNQISMDAYLNANQKNSSTSFYNTITTQKVTEKLKTIFTLYSNYNEDKYEFSDGSEYLSISKTAYFSNLTAISLNDHWSMGASFNLKTSTYQNINLKFKIGPAIEYNFLKYSESNKHLLTLFYKISYNHYSYIDTTIFNETEENLYDQYLRLSMKFIKKWGDLETGISYENYLHNFKYDGIWIYTEANIRIYKNLFFDLTGSGGFSHNQLNLPRVGLSDAEILTEKRERQSAFTISSSYGLSFRFGSTSNHIVNPRMN